MGTSHYYQRPSLLKIPHRCCLHNHLSFLDDVRSHCSCQKRRRMIHLRQHPLNMISMISGVEHHHLPKQQYQSFANQALICFYWQKGMAVMHSFNFLGLRYYCAVVVSRFCRCYLASQMLVVQWLLTRCPLNFSY